MEVGDRTSRRWEGVLAGQATRGWFDVHRIECTRVQSPGVYLQSVMSTVYIRSDLIGRWQTDHGCRGHGDRISQDRTCKSSTCECMGYYANRVSTVPEAFLRPFKFLSDTDGAKAILGIQKWGPQE